MNILEATTLATEFAATLRRLNREMQAAQTVADIETASERQNLFFDVKSNELANVLDALVARVTA